MEVLTAPGGVRIEGAFEGNRPARYARDLRRTGRVTCQNVRANTVIVAGAVRSNITTQNLSCVGPRVGRCDHNCICDRRRVLLVKSDGRIRGTILSLLHRCAFRSCGGRIDFANANSNP